MARPAGAIIQDITSLITCSYINSFGAEMDKSRHNGLSAEIDYSPPLGGECYRLYSLSTEVA